MKVAVIIPTRNGGELWKKTLSSIASQSKYIDNVIIIDSNSSDDTVSSASAIASNCIPISENDFDHGGTRNLACQSIHEDVDVVVFMTQDAILASPSSLYNLISAFDDPEVAAAYGRQLPHEDATAISCHAREFNYPSQGYRSSLKSKQSMGLKTVFMSNSFSAYRLSVFRELGGFPEKTILCEDMHFTARAVLAGYSIAYVPNATVYHSHNYTAVDEFKRYFDIGVFHRNEPWIRETFGGAGRVGQRFINSELSYLIRVAPGWIPPACVNNLMKFLGYKLGAHYERIPMKLRKIFSMHEHYWDAFEK